MTINQLHKQLTKLIEQGHARTRVYVAKTTFVDNREMDGVTILPVQGLGVQWVPLADDDGGTATTKDGRERGSQSLILAGGGGVNSKGELLDGKDWTW